MSEHLRSRQRALEQRLSPQEVEASRLSMTKASVALWALQSRYLEGGWLDLAPDVLAKDEVQAIFRNLGVPTLGQSCSRATL